MGRTIADRIDKRMEFSWVLSIDYQVKGKSHITAIGLRSGRITVLTSFGDYHYNIHSMVNKIAIVKERYPKIVVAVGTHGEGIKIIDGEAMNFQK